MLVFDDTKRLKIYEVKYKRPHLIATHCIQHSAPLASPGWKERKKNRKKILG